MTTADAGPLADRRILCPVLIGRSAEMNQLEVCVRDCLGGRGRTVLVSGEAGVGKTAMLRDFVKRARAIGTRVLVSECTEIEARRPFGPFMDIARAANRADALPVASSDTAAAAGDRYRLYSAFANLFGDLARERPIVIVIEDLQWADEASLELFPHLARKLRDVGLLLIGTYRSDELHRRHPLRPVLAELSRTRVAEDIPLRPLGEDDVAEFLSEAMHLGRPPTPEFRQAIHRTCEGNPLFMEEVLRALVERGDIELRDGSWRRTKDVAEIAIPDTLRDAVLERFASLSAESQGILRHAAVIGQQFDFDLLSRVTGEREELIVASLRAAIAVQLLQEVGKDGGSEQYAFRHALSRESILIDLLGRERRRIHGAVGEAIESRVGRLSTAHAEDLAYHFDQAGDTKRASLYHEMAANEAARLFAYRRVVEHLDRVAALAPEGDLHVANTQLRHAKAARGAEDDTRAVRVAIEARELFSQAGDARGEADALLVAASSYANLRDYERALAAAREAARILGPHGETPSVAAAHGEIARTAMLTGDWTSAIRSAELAIAIARSVGAADVEIHAEVTLGASIGRRTSDRRAEGLERLRSAIARGIAEGAFLPTDRGFVNLCDALRSRSPADTQRTATADYSAYARTHGFPRSTALCSEADLPLVDGDWDAVLRIAAEGAGQGHYADWLQLKEAFVRVGRAGPASGLPLVEDPRRRLALLGWPNRDPQAVLISQVFALAGEHVKSLAFAEDYAAAVESGNPDRPLDGLTLCAIYAARALGDGSALRRWIGLALGAPQVVPAPFDAQRAYATAEHRASQGDIDGALLSLDESARIFADAFVFDSVFPLTAIRLRRVELLLARASSSREAAIAEFALVLSYWRKAKATWYLGQLERWATALGLAFPGEASTPGTSVARAGRSQLTPREREVATLVGSGHSNKEIAEKLVISERTAEAHVEHILAKLEFHSRSEIASWHAGGNPRRSAS
ncbi:MAG TPA: AAA family ATPase [Candidatus Bathyarchaeia archaeon]|nr:AAA family ATPase [Candidatus Bathyarchaeia archaeon]